MPETSARTIDLDGRAVPFLLRRSGRARWIRADIGLRTGLRVTLPAGLEEAAVEPFLRSRRRWIVRTLRRFERLAGRIPDRPLADGTPVPFLGLDLTLALSVGPAEVRREGGVLRVRVPRRARGTIRRVLEQWYRAEAERHLPARASECARRHGLVYTRVRIGDARTLWGSCSRTGTLSFNWRLMLAPEAVAAYLVAHELAHLEEPGHSPRFWRKVEALDPTYREQELWLRRNGIGLTL